LTVQRFFSAVERLFQFPESGRIVPEVQDPSLREVIIGSYRIVYRLIRTEIHIITIHHAARLFKLED
jgi:toxin ParE1/3/4